MYSINIVYLYTQFNLIKTGDKYGTWNSSMVSWYSDPDYYFNHLVLALVISSRGYGYENHRQYTS